MAEEKDFKNIKLTEEQIKRVLGERKECILDPDLPCVYCGECLMCDLEENKLCNNCGKCIDSINTDEKGFVKVPIDKIIRDDNIQLEDLLKQYGLDDDEEE